MRLTHLETIGKIIQWAANQQVDLLLSYESKWGFSSKSLIWDVYVKLINEELPKRINPDKISPELLYQLIQFLSNPLSDYHLEMSFDELAQQFLNAIEKE